MNNIGDVPSKSDIARVQLEPEQIILIQALQEKKHKFIADAYDAGLKIIWLVRNPKTLTDSFITIAMATCLVAHLGREIINVLIRGDDEATRVDYTKPLGLLIQDWQKNDFVMDGEVPSYKPNIYEVKNEDVVLPRSSVKVMASLIKEHDEKGRRRVDSKKLLMRDIYGEGSEETPESKAALKWMSNNDLLKYAHLSEKVYGSPDAKHFQDVVDEFLNLERLLQDRCRDHFEVEGELDEILSEANG